jgi:hypothetical protein
MAYEDLTPQERETLQKSLLAPPPATFAAPGQLNIDPQTRMEAQLGLLGPQGRFIEQLARQQDEAQREARSVQMAQTLQGISPLDPEYVSKVQTIAKSDPLAFNSGTVQQVLQLGQMAIQEERRAQQEAKAAQEEARRAAETAQAQTVASELLSGPPESLTQRAMELAEKYPGAATSGEFGRALQLGAQMEADQRRTQEEAKRTQAEQRRSQLAQSVLNLPAKTFTQSLRELTKLDPEAGRSPEVNNAINIREAEIRERQAKRGQKKERKQKRAEAEVKATIANATPDQLDQLAERFPQFLPDIEKRSSDLSTIEEAASQLPPSLRTPENLSKGHKAKAALNKFNKSLPPQLQKLTSYEQRKAAAEAADAYLQQAKAFEAAAKQDEDAEPPEALENLRRLATVELGLDPDSVTLPDELLGKIAKTRVLFEEVPPETFLPESVRQSKGIRGPMGIVVE